MFSKTRKLKKKCIPTQIEMIFKNKKKKCIPTQIEIILKTKIIFRNKKDTNEPDDVIQQHKVECIT